MALEKEDGGRKGALQVVAVSKRGEVGNESVGGVGADRAGEGGKFLEGLPSVIGAMGLDSAEEGGFEGGDVFRG